MDDATIKSLAEASQAIGLLQGLVQSLPQPADIGSAICPPRSGTATESKRANQEELVLFELDRQTAEDKPDVREVWNYVSAFEYGLKRLKDLPVCLRLIRELHEKLMHGVRGSDRRPGEFRKFRTTLVVKASQSRKHATYHRPRKNSGTCLDAFERSQLMRKRNNRFSSGSPDPLPIRGDTSL